MGYIFPFLHCRRGFWVLFKEPSELKLDSTGHYFGSSLSRSSSLEGPWASSLAVSARSSATSKINSMGLFSLIPSSRAELICSFQIKGECWDLLCHRRPNRIGSVLH